MKKISCILISILLILIALSTQISAVKLSSLDGNNPPNPPVVDAPESNPAKIWFKVYCTVTDPDGDDIYYRTQMKTSIGWQEPSNWVGPFASGEEQYSLIKSSVDQEITIGYQAKDTYGAESEWTYVDVTITKSKIYNGYLQILSSLQNLLSRLTKLY